MATAELLHGFRFALARLAGEAADGFGDVGAFVLRVHALVARLAAAGAFLGLRIGPVEGGGRVLLEPVRLARLGDAA